MYLGPVSNNAMEKDIKRLISDEDMEGKSFQEIEDFILKNNPNIMKKQPRTAQQIKKILLNKFTSNGYKVEEVLNQLIINDTIEMNFTDELIEGMDKDGFSILEIYNSYLDNYNKVISE